MRGPRLMRRAWSKGTSSIWMGGGGSAMVSSLRVVLTPLRDRLVLIDRQPHILAGILRLLQGEHLWCPLQAIQHHYHLVGRIRTFQCGEEFVPRHGVLPGSYTWH